MGLIALFPTAESRELLQTNPAELLRQPISGGAAAFTAACAALIFWLCQFLNVGFRCPLNSPVDLILYRSDSCFPEQRCSRHDLFIICGIVFYCYIRCFLRRYSFLRGRHFLMTCCHAENQGKPHQKAQYLFHKAAPNLPMRRPSSAGLRRPYPLSQGRGLQQ